MLESYLLSVYNWAMNKTNWNGDGDVMYKANEHSTVEKMACFW